MSKKIIAILVVATVVFMCIFAGCSKKGVYTDPKTGKEYILVTDENGQKILSDDGELLVYATEDNGKIVTDADGSQVTDVHGFIGQIEEDGIVEDFAYKLFLPDGWSSTDTFGTFQNKSAKQICVISILDETYDDYYKTNKEVYDQVVNSEDVEEATWEEEVKIHDDAEKVVRFTMKSKDGMRVMYFYENSGNTYKVLFDAESPDGALEAAEEFVKSIKYKPYTYFPDEEA